MNLPQSQWGLPKKYFTIGIALFFPLYFLWILSSYINYGAEGILINGLRRILEGNTYVSALGELPVTLSTYFPGFYLFYYPVLKIFGITEPQNIAYGVRLLTPIYYMAFFWHFISFLAYDLKKELNLKLFLVCLGYFLFKEFDVFFAFKPDGLSLCFEITGMLQCLKYCQNSKYRNLIFGAILFGIAGSLKLNAVALGLGVGLGLIILRRWKALALFTISGLVTLSFGLGGTYFYLGGDLFTEVLKVTQTDLIPVFDIFSVIRRVVWQVFFGYLLIFLLVASSLKPIAKKWLQSERTLLLCGFFLVFILGSLGQLKDGAFLNYYYVGLVLGILVASTQSIKEFSSQNYTLVKSALLLSLLISYGLCWQRGIWIVANDLKYYDFEAMNSFIDKEWSNAKIYTEHNNAATHLGKRAITGVSFFVFLRSNKKVDILTPNYRDQLFSNNFLNAIVSLGKHCEKPTFNPRFASEILKRSPKLVYHKGKICIFELNKQEITSLKI